MLTAFFEKTENFRLKVIWDNETMTRYKKVGVQIYDINNYSGL